MFTTIESCRICHQNHLNDVFDLGNMSLTGIFPKSRETKIASGPVSLVKCDEGSGGCGLVQLKQTYSLEDMYGENYGYRSGLNQSMVKHLSQATQDIQQRINLETSDIVLDIGSNDSTLLQSYTAPNLKKIGIDPSAEKFRKYYSSDINLVVDFFSKDNFQKIFSNEKAKVITAFSMFYDLPDPVSFTQDVAEVLSPDGIFIIEQSYLPEMVRTNSFDTICQEHLEFYSLKQIEWIFNKSNLKIIDVVFNKTNGGSFRVYGAHVESKHYANDATIKGILQKEIDDGFATNKPFITLQQNIERQRQQLLSFLREAKQNSKRVIGYGASTKGNVLLQYFNITSDLVDCIAEVNPDKYGCFTPGTNIPIISEIEAKEQKPDYLFVLPWHFKEFIITKENAYLQSGGKLVFPLPSFEIVGK